MIFLGEGFGFTKDTFYPKEAGLLSKIGMTEGFPTILRASSPIRADPKTRIWYPKTQLQNFSPARDLRQESDDLLHLK